MSLKCLGIDSSVKQIKGHYSQNCAIMLLFMFYVIDISTSYMPKISHEKKLSASVFIQVTSQWIQKIVQLIQEVFQFMR